MKLVEKQVDDILIKLRNHANEELELARKMNDYQTGYWHGYVDAINDILIRKAQGENAKYYFTEI
jgi:hypothetical protein